MIYAYKTQDIASCKTLIMLKVLSYILCDLDPKVKVIGQKAGICDGVPSTSALVKNYFSYIST